MAVTPSGKDKLVRHMRCYYAGYDLSGDFRNIDSLENSFGEADMTGVSENFKSYLVGTQRQVGARGVNVFMNDDTNRGFDILKDANNSGCLIVAMGGGGAPAVGDPAYLLPTIQMSDNPSIESNAFVFAADFLYISTADRSYSGNPLGVLLQPAGTISTTTTQSSIDCGASNSNGGLALLEVLSTASGDFTIEIEHSTNDSDWSSLTTFSADGSAVTWEQDNINGTINRYIRFVATRTAGSMSVVCALARNY